MQFIRSISLMLNEEQLLNLVLYLDKSHLYSSLVVITI